MSTAVRTREFTVDPELPTGEATFTVEYRAEQMGVTELVRTEFDTELAAVQCMGSVILYDNLTPVAYGSNIDPSRFVR